MKSFIHLLTLGDACQRREENYLNSAKSLAELEYRQRQINNGLFKPKRPFL